MTSTRDLLVLTIETLTGNAFEVIMHKQALVSDLKLRLKYMIGIETEDQHILFGLVELKDFQTLEHYHIKTGSKLKLVTSMKGGPISYKAPPPPPSLFGFTTFLYNSPETEQSLPRISKKESEKNENKKDHSAFYVLHDGLIIKVREFVSENAEDDAKEYIKRLSQNTIDEEILLSSVKSKATIENEKLKERMQNLRKHMEETSSVKEKLKKRKLPRPDISSTKNKTSFSGSQQSKSKSFSDRMEEEMSRISKMSKDMPKEKDETKSKNGVRDEEKKYEKNERGKKEERDVKKKSNDIHHRMNSNEPCPLDELIRITSIHLVERPASIRKTSLPVAAQAYTRLQSSMTNTSKLSEHLRDVDKQKLSKCSIKIRPSLSQHALRDNDSDSKNKPNHNSDLQDSACMNNKVLPRRVKFEKGERSKAPVSKFKKCDRNTKEIKRKSNSQMSNKADYNNLLPLMSLMRNTKRSWERNSSSGHRTIGLTSRRCTHDGLTRVATNFDSRKDSIPNLLPFAGKKMNLSKRVTDQRPSGIVVEDRCALCNKKLGITNSYRCRCNKLFCNLHKFPEEHNCDYDYKKGGKEKLEKENPSVAGNKIKKL